jgi:hypothetical protein
MDSINTEKQSVYVWIVVIAEWKKLLSQTIIVMETLMRM